MEIPSFGHKMNHWERMFRVKLIKFFRVFRRECERTIHSRAEKANTAAVVRHFCFIRYWVEQRREIWNPLWMLYENIFPKKNCLCLSCILRSMFASEKISIFKVQSEKWSERRGGWRGVEGAAKSTCIIITLVHNQAIIVAPALSILVSPSRFLLGWNVFRSIMYIITEKNSIS